MASKVTGGSFRLSHVMDRDDVFFFCFNVALCILLLVAIKLANVFLKNRFKARDNEGILMLCLI